MLPMKIPQSIIFAIVALNVSAFGALLQLDLILPGSTIAKTVTWTLAVACWAFAYLRRDKYFRIM